MSLVPLDVCSHDHDEIGANGSSGKPSPLAEPSAGAGLHDTVLQRAVDMLLTRAHLDAARLSWDPATGEAPPTVRKATRAP